MAQLGGHAQFIESKSTQIAHGDTAKEIGEILGRYNDGIAIRLSLPQLTEERRREYVKVAKHMAEDGRIAVRNARRDARKAMESAEKEGEISADELERAEKELEKVTHEHVEHIDEALGRKEQELLEI